MSRILVTGGTGFVGRSFIEKALHDYEVHVITRKKTLDLVGVTTHQTDIESLNELERIFEEVRPNHVIHLAAMIDKSRDPALLDQLLRTNVLGTRQLLEVAVKVGVSSFIGIGTFEEYGNAPTPFMEDGPIFPETPYGQTKSTSSLLIAQYGKEALATCVLRFPVLYGPRMPENTFMGKLRNAVHGRGKIPLADSPVSRDFLHINDAIDGIFLAMQDTQRFSGEIINVCSGIEVTLKKVVEVAEVISGVTPLSEIGAFTQRPQEQLSYVGSNKKALELLGWKPRVELAEGLQRFFT